MVKDLKFTEKNNALIERKPKISFEILKSFSSDVHHEFNKIAWPDKKHTMASTGVVVVLVMMISFYLSSVDLIIGKLIGNVLN